MGYRTLGRSDPSKVHFFRKSSVVGGVACRSEKKKFFPLSPNFRPRCQSNRGRGGEEVSGDGKGEKGGMDFCGFPADEADVFPPTDHRQKTRGTYY